MDYKTSAARPNLAVLDRLIGQRIVVVGDVMLDKYLSGAIERVSPEAPVPVLRYGGESAVPGGAANVAANVASLGGQPVLLSITGDDADADTLAALCGGLAVDAGGLLRDAGRDTTVKTRVIARDQQLLRIDQDCIRPLAAASRQALLDRIAGDLALPSTLVLSDYGKGVLADGMAAALIDLAQARGRRAIVDPKNMDFAVYRGADLITPNLAELAMALGTRTEALRDDAAVVEGARALIDRFDFRNLLVTLSERGMVIVTADGEATLLPTRARSVFDVSGAGDTVVAAVALGLEGGLGLEEASALANCAAGLAVAEHRTARVTADQVAHSLGANPMADNRTSRKAAVELVEAWRKQGRVVGFTNGCFDILHPGHIRLLASAAAQCDSLVVGLNSDASVRRLKGDDRPLHNEADRATVLSALTSVDLICVFDEDTPAELIEALRPDVLVKGADYEVEEIVGAESVLARGGRVLRVPLVDGASTSSIADKISRL